MSSHDKAPGSMRAQRDSAASSDDRVNPSLLKQRAVNENIVRRGIPALAFVDHPLREDALALVFLGQKHEPGRFIVVQRQSFTDNVLDTAMEVALKWQREVPDDDSPMKAVLYNDGRYEIEWNGHRSNGVMILRRGGGSAEMMSPELLERAAKTSPIVIAGVGPARVVHLK